MPAATTWDSTLVTWDSLVATWSDALPESPWPVVSVWEDQGSNVWALVARIGVWTTIDLEPRFNAAGTWSLVLPWSEQSNKITKTRLVTFDWRGWRFTGRVDSYAASAGEDGAPVLAVGGLDAFDVVADYLCWPSPTQLLTGQGVRYSASGVAETVLRNLMLANRDRRGDDWAIPASQGRGASITLGERWTPMGLVVAEKATAAGLGVRAGLVDDPATSTRASLQVEFYVPVDRTARVRLSYRVGTLRSWALNNVAPTATRVIVGGDGKGASRVYRQITDTAAEGVWGRIREMFADARGTSALAELDERGVEALAEAAEQSSFELETVEAAGMRFIQHYGLGDTVTVEPIEGEATTERVNAARLAFGDSGVSVQIIPGNPDTSASNPLFKLAEILRGLRRRLSHIEREEQ